MHICIYMLIYVYLHIYECVYRYICKYAYMCVYRYICKYAYICMYVSIYMGVCMYIYMYIYAYICTYIRVYIYVPMHICMCVCVYIYRRYHTITDVCTTALLPTKPSSDDDSSFRHGFGAAASLPLAQSAPAVSPDTTRVCQIVVNLWDCHIHADAVRVLSWIFFMYFFLSNGGSPRLVKKIEVELVMKPLHPTSIGSKFIIQPFLTHCSRRSSNFFNCTQSKFSSKGTVNSITKTFFALTDQMTISGRFVVNAISVTNMKLCFKSVATSQWWFTYIFTWKFRNISIFNELNCICVCIYMCIYIYMCVYICFYAYICVCIYGDRQKTY